MTAEELALLKTRVEKLEHISTRVADVVRRSLIAIVRILEREFELPPLN